MAIVVIVYGFSQKFRWSRAVAELREVSQNLEASHGSYGHRVLYRSFDDITTALLEFSKPRPAARWVLDDLRPVVAQYHRRAVVASAGAWDEIRNAFLERRRHPVRVMRAAAGWVVLIGLAGTVLGFMEALPALREVLASQADEIEAAPNPEGKTASGAEGGVIITAPPGAEEKAALTARKLYRVLDSLRGVFLATLAGVILAFVLSGCNLIFLEPAFDRFADSVDVLGARWFEPLIQAPDTLVDDALRAELRFYFDEIGKRLETVLAPIVSQLRVSLEQMSGLASDFSGNIQIGIGTLRTFHDAVEKLGGSAQDAVGQLVQIVNTSGDFVREVESLQHKGLKQLAGALSGPAAILANSAASMDARVQALEAQISALGEASRAIAGAIGEHSQGEAALRQDLSSTVGVLQNQTTAMSHVRTSLDGTARSLRNELTPLFATLSQEIVQMQTRSAHENRATVERMAAGVESIRGMLAALEAIASPGRIQEEKRALEEFRRAIDHLSHHLEQQKAMRHGAGSSRLELASQRGFLEQVQPPSENRALRRQLVEEAAGGVANSSETRSIQQDDPAPREKSPPERGITRLLRWLGFGRFSKGRGL